ncbi:MAG: hypothetical protein A3I89_03540 [Candidatus Harrisonbacteria bacterium RIFCSPLOWO2_02_FULL_41_11]|uniref:Heat-inducible transcription repressor HrcA C-terminal domain-containing protein n=1 Tax=Candidatus Harrisonbacteria bacterium RIFCSPHIGHO2_02_FULL_42_16 TaxID=1798404 RepID=A0A1G1ZGN7_9BACT|nr:MAG: hypothetical protein A3B92_00605 [Candidatus Harrisonbacteria bacterium RIFCSPHIGHO2_02_FULL_42_16]OGY65889.1 MAG: hypothetical protein A3I89_03540 [Candidatus Harrisonbacteria bacterium RIFCSPLOWO2_02_FULL_41_11]
MTTRTASILEAAIKEYIRSGQPVSSRELEKQHDFGVKEATIRNELNRLTKDGFLAQLHTSGGRVPTDKGYQFFVGKTLDNVASSNKILNQPRYSRLADNLRKDSLRDFVDAFSNEVKLLGVGQREKEKTIYKSGLDELFVRLDLETKSEFQEIVRDFEMLDERFDNLKNKIFRSLPEPQVFIGKKSPITDSENLSVIMDSYDIGGHKVLIAIIGPKRMDYNKNFNLLKLLHEYDE